MHLKPINLKERLSTFDDLWSPKIVTTFNGHDIMVVKVKGEFIWHEHADTDDFFMVLEGEIVIETEHGAIPLKKGEVYVVPKGVAHRPVAIEEAQLLIIETKGTPNTGSIETAVVKEHI